jgi:hypothetical protein
VDAGWAGEPVPVVPVTGGAVVDDDVGGAVGVPGVTGEDCGSGEPGVTGEDGGIDTPGVTDDAELTAPATEAAVVLPCGDEALCVVITAPLAVVRAMKLLGLGAWMFEIACWAWVPKLAGRNPTLAGPGITIPCPAARRSIRWSSASVATLARSCSFVL